MQTNSGASACGISASGVRKEGVEVVVDIIRQYPNVDGFTVAWLFAGGEIRDGRLVGTTQAMNVDVFAQAVSIQKRIKDAEMKKLIKPVPYNRVVRVRDGRRIEAQAFIVADGVPLQLTPAPPAKPPERKADPVNVASMMDDLRALLG